MLLKSCHLHFHLEPRSLTLDDLELSWFNVIKITLKYFENGDRYDDVVNESKSK